MGKLAVDKVTYREQVAGLCAAERARFVIEVGVWKAGLSHKLLEVESVKTLHLVDSWKTYRSHHSPQIAMDKAFWKVREIFCKDPRVLILREGSPEAALRFEDGLADFIHIDADHDETAVTADIKAWIPKLRPGGLLNGDDYYMPSVMAAVDRLLPERKLLEGGRVWWWRKP